MYTIRKKFKFEMAHQLIGSYSIDCRGIHGHSYICEIFLRSDKLDKTGMVCDFKAVKDNIKDYIDSWDHCVVLNSDLAKNYIDYIKNYNDKVKIVDYNPTAELMAKDMYDYIKERIPELYKIRLHETDTGWAEYQE